MIEMENNFKTVDVIQQTDYRELLNEFVRSTVITENHHNADNYRFILNEPDLTKYYHRFSMLLDSEDTVISIQGIRHSANNMPYPKNVVRIADRCYSAPKFRSSTLGPRYPYYLNHCLHPDINYLTTHHPQVDTAFISIQGQKGKDFFKKQYLIRLNDMGYNFHTDDNFYKTCINEKSKLCWQTCIYTNLKGGVPTLPLEFIQYNEWMTKDDN